MSVLLRPYEAARDEEPAIALWLAAWEATLPEIDFAARLDWWRKRWREELVPACRIVVAEAGDGSLAGFVTVDGAGYLDQIAVAPAHWGAGVGDALMEAAKELSPSGLELRVNTQNPRALAFYARHGFRAVADEINASGRPVKLMRWP